MTTGSSVARESRESRELVRAAFSLARTLEIEKLLVRAELSSDIREIGRSREDETIVWVTDGSREAPVGKKDRAVVIPNYRLSGSSQVTLAIFVAVLRGYLQVSESVVCLSGASGSKHLDSVLITNPKRDFPWLRKDDVWADAKGLAVDVVEAVLQLALQISVGGYEGKPVGTAFVIGEPEKLESRLRQMILNPCKGHPVRARSVRNPEFADTIRELSALDGAFIVDGRGTVLSAATYLDASTRKVRVRPGLGARHTSAAAVTVGTGAVAVVVSESTGAVTVFREGKAVLELEKPQPTGVRRASPR